MKIGFQLVHQLIEGTYHRDYELTLDEHSRKYRDYWGGYGSHEKVGDYWPRDYSKRIVRAFIGKPVNDAFSYFCSIVKHDRMTFWEEFRDDTIEPRRWRRSRDPEYYPYYWIDENNLIQYNKGNREPEKVSLKSGNLVEAFKHKKTGKIHIIKPLNLDEPAWKPDYERAGFERWLWNEDSYERVLVNGTITLTSRNDYRYKRKQAEDRKRSKLDNIERKRRIKEKVYSFDSEDKIQKRKRLEAEAAIKIESHGFDYLSFMGSAYHGQKRKLARFERNQLRKQMRGLKKQQQDL